MKKRINWFWIGFAFLCFLIGIIIGIPFGMEKQQQMIFEGIGIALSGSNINFTIQLNETELVNQMNKTIVPQFRDIAKDMISKEEYEEWKKNK